jgi:hypothetical protein
MIPSTEKHTKPETERILQLADAYADVPPSQPCGHQRCALENAIERIIADRDTLAAGVEEYHCRLPAHQDEAVMKAALEVTRRLKAASEPAKPPAAKPVATATGGPKSAEYAEPADISPLAEKLATMRVMVASQRDSNGNGFTGSDDAIAAVAAVVEALAKEDR